MARTDLRTLFEQSSDEKWKKQAAKEFEQLNPRISDLYILYREIGLSHSDAMQKLSSVFIEARKQAESQINRAGITALIEKDLQDFSAKGIKPKRKGVKAKRR